MPRIGCDGCDTTLGAFGGGRSASPRGKAAFVIQLALNLAWSPVFFGAHQITLALAILIALDVAVIVTDWEETWKGPGEMPANPPPPAPEEPKST